MKRKDLTRIKRARERTKQQSPANKAGERGAQLVLLRCVIEGHVWEYYLFIKQSRGKGCGLLVLRSCVIGRRVFRLTPSVRERVCCLRHVHVFVQWQHGKMATWQLGNMAALVNDEKTASYFQQRQTGHDSQKLICTDTSVLAPLHFYYVRPCVTELQ